MFLRPSEAPRVFKVTRLSVEALKPRVAESTILYGCTKRGKIFSPKTAKIQIIYSDVSFQFRRLQFPLDLVLSMSTNTAQGHFLEAVNLIPERN
jgi:ATP-dependent DNA helicase PIF1